MDDLIQPRHPEQPAAGESANPVLVEVVRGDFVESRHRGAIAVVAPDGTVVPAIGDVTREMFPRSAIKPVQALHNNCSGKHAGMIATALHKGEAVDGYTNVTHPVQQRVLGVFESMTGYDLGRAARGIDGCTVPVWAMPLGNLALAMARMADPADQPEVRQAAVTRIRDAMAAQPFYIHGSNAFGTNVIAAAGPEVLVKGGAEGVYTAILPALGFGVALKIDDGASRAAELAMIHTLHQLDALTTQQRAILTDRLHPVQTNWSGKDVGTLRPTAALKF